jgi:uncharacterized ion transporter superfamily protein YfcC
MTSFRLPNPLTLLVGCTFIAAALTHVLPAGQYEQRNDPVTGRSVVVAGTYHQVPAHPLGPFDAVVAIPRGLIDAASVVFFVFLIGGAFAVVDQTGALRDGIDWLVRRLGNYGLLAIPIVSLAFAAGGASENMQEEIVALVPALLLLTQRLGFNALTAAAISVGAAAVGSAFSPINPFQVGIAQKVAQLPQASGTGYRLIFLALALAIWIAGSMRLALRTRVVPAAAPSATPADGSRNGRGGVIIALVVITFGVFIYGIKWLNWDFDQEAALFFVMGVLAGLIGGLGIAGTSEAFIEGFRSMTYAALLVGFARAISVAMQEGLIIDTVVHGLSIPLATLPVGVAAVGMMAVQAAIHVGVPSVSGQAVLTIPVFAPLADLVGMTRQVAVLAFQYGAGLCELLTPTNGGLLAVLAALGVRYDSWLRAVWPLVASVVALAMVGILIAVTIHW